MERLTERSESGFAYWPKCFEEPCYGGECKDENCSLMRDSCEKLTTYEDLEKQGLLLRLPCRERTKVYLARKCLAPSCEKCKGYLSVNNCLTQYKGRIFEQEFDIERHWRSFGKTVFLTYEAAERGLAEQEDNFERT